MKAKIILHRIIAIYTKVMVATNRQNIQSLLHFIIFPMQFELSLYDNYSESYALVCDNNISMHNPSNNYHIFWSKCHHGPPKQPFSSTFYYLSNDGKSIVVQQLLIKLCLFMCPLCHDLARQRNWVEKHKNTMAAWSSLTTSIGFNDPKYCISN